MKQNDEQIASIKATVESGFEALSKMISDKEKPGSAQGSETVIDAARLDMMRSTTERNNAKAAHTQMASLRAIIESESFKLLSTQTDVEV